MMAEALAGPLARAVAAESVEVAGGRRPTRRGEPKGLPPPMVPGNSESPTTVCAMQVCLGVCVCGTAVRMFFKTASDQWRGDLFGGRGGERGGGC
jgi:hypothetical protein